MAAAGLQEIESEDISDAEFAALSAAISAAEAGRCSHMPPFCCDLALDGSISFFAIRARPNLPAFVANALRKFSLSPHVEPLTFPIDVLERVLQSVATLAPTAIVNGIPEPVRRIHENLIARSSSPYLGSRAALVRSTVGDQMWDQLLPFQKEGVLRAITIGGRVLLADDMGMGKTVSALALAQFYRLHHAETACDDSCNVFSNFDVHAARPARVSPVLILCPSTLREHWGNAVRRWFPDIRTSSIFILTSAREAVALFQSQHKGKRDLWDKKPELQFVIASYDLFPRLASGFGKEDDIPCEEGKDANWVTSSGAPPVWDQPSTRDIFPKFGIVIADECHSLKSPCSARTRACLPVILSAEFRILVSGTPMTSRPSELYCVLWAIFGHAGANGTFISPELYAHRYCGGAETGFRSATNLGELHAILSSVMIRRTKGDIPSSLPPKIRGQCLLKLSPNRRKKFERMFAQLSDIHSEMNDACTTPELKMILKARYQSLHTFMYAATASAKIPGILTRLGQLVLPDNGLGESVLLFAFHRQILDAAENYLRRNRISFVRIDGDSPPFSRQSLVDTYQTNELVKVALLSIKVAGTGLTLTKADRIVFAELDWVPSSLLQAEDRAHRLGRLKPLFVEYIVADGTLDDCMWSTVRRKFVTVRDTIDRRRGSCSEIDTLQFSCELATDDLSVQTTCLSGTTISAEDLELDLLAN